MITRTGWTFKQVDDSPVARIMDLLEYWRREAEWQREAMDRAGRGESPSSPRQAWHEPTEEEATMMFNMMPRASLDTPGVAQDITRIPDEMKDMIRWAEGMKREKMVH